MLQTLQKEIYDNPSSTGESIMLGSVIGAGDSPAKRFRLRSNTNNFTNFNESEIEWSQSNAEDV